jgi:predicted CXXCH cytochrome family protein
MNYVSRPGQLLRKCLFVLHPSLWLVALAAALVVVGCSSPQQKQKWLTFFFDGVPTAGATTNQPVVQLDEDGRPLVFVQAPQTNLAAFAAPAFTKHPPYDEKKCSECHVSKFSVEMKGSQKQVCFGCHKDFLTTAKVKHQPAENSECTACHEPHGGPLPKMVTKAGKALCLECHDDPLANLKVLHTPVSEGCHECHTPHASEHAKLLTKSTKALCFECHDDFLEKAKVKHTPAESGECSSCHTPHASNNKFLLAKSGKSMCFECHDDFLEKAPFKHSAVDECSECHNSHVSEHSGLLTRSPAALCTECHELKDLERTEGHKNMGDKSCLSCHDPHVGKDKYLLREAVLKAALEAPAK